MLVIGCLISILVVQGNGLLTAKVYETARRTSLIRFLQEVAPTPWREPYENPNLVEGDMIFHPDDPTMPRGVARRGNGVAWRNGVVPYAFTPEFSPKQQSIVVETMQKLERLIAINNVACVQFRPRIATDRHFITIRNGQGCSSAVGESVHNLSEHPVTLEYPGCFLEGIVMHELLHTLGFYHEQSRPDRDDYVRVIYDNIYILNRHNFEKYNDSFVNALNTPYDYSSLMHYSPTAFSNNGQPTIIPLQSNVTIGQRDTLSDIDVQEVRLLYNCSATGVTLPTITATTTVNVFLVNTTLASAWTINSPIFMHAGSSAPNFFYGVYYVTVPSSGSYMLMSHSNVDTIGYLYNGRFSPLYPDRDLLIRDDDSGGNGQFRITTFLQSNLQYILVVTTYQPSVLGVYTVAVSGLVRASIVQNDTATVPPSSSNATTSSYSSILSNASLSYTRENPSGKFYLEAIQIYPLEYGIYTLNSASSMDTVAYLYYECFDPANISRHLLISDDGRGLNGQFSMSFMMYPSAVYILVVSTRVPNVTGSFLIHAMGLGGLTFERVDVSSSSMCDSTQHTSTATPSPYFFCTNLASTWTNASRRYARTSGSSGLHFYETFQVTVPVNGSYMFTSDSAIDTYGCLHNGSFSPEAPAENRLSCDDNSAGIGSFRIIAYLEYYVTYVILATTFRENTVGEYMLSVCGPQKANVIPTGNTSILISINISAIQPIVPIQTLRPTLALATTTSNTGKLTMSGLFLIGYVLTIIPISYDNIIS